MPEFPRGEKLRVEAAEGVAVVTLDDPARRNALSLEMSAELVRVLDTLESSGEVNALVVTGAPPCFCAGADLAQLEGADENGLRAIYAGFARVASSPLVTVAAVNGPAVGAGMNMALACDIRLASELARFDTRFLALGLHPGGGHGYLLQRAVGYSEAVVLLLGGQVVAGEEAARIGLVHAVVPDGDLVGAAKALVAPAAAAPGALVARIKESLTATREAGYDRALEHELDEQLWSVRQPAFVERIAALRAKISSRPGNNP